MSELPATAVLLLSCPDRRGIVASVTNFVFQNGGNIVHASQHTDREQGLFFQRVEWELAEFQLNRTEMPTAFEKFAEQFGMRWSLHFSDARPRVAVFASREGHCLYDLLSRYRMGEIRAEIPLVVSNHPDLRSSAEIFGVEYHHYPVTPATKAAQEMEVVSLLEQQDVDLIVLARYMQILSPSFVSRYPNRLINIHHSFLPAFAGSRPYHQAYEHGVKLIGATAHYVTEELDQGPIIAQGVTAVSHRDSIAEMVHKGKDLEKKVLAQALNLHLAHRVVAHGRKTVVFD